MEAHQMADNDLKTELINTLIDKYVNAESEADVSFYRRLEAEAYCTEDSDFRTRRLTNFRQGIKETESLARSLRKLYWGYLIYLRDGLMSPERIRDQLIERENKRLELLELMRKT
jgi:hypothetical protein